MCFIRRLPIVLALVLAAVAVCGGRPAAAQTSWSVSTAGDLTAALAGAFTNNVSNPSLLNTITLAGNVSGSSQWIVNANVSIVGNGYTIDMNNTDRAFFIAGGTVGITNLTIQNGHAIGGTGYASGGGGAGLGAGIFVGSGTYYGGVDPVTNTASIAALGISAPQVTLSGVAFVNNVASGGNSPLWQTDQVLGQNPQGGGGGGMGGDGGPCVEGQPAGQGGGGFGAGATGAGYFTETLVQAGSGAIVNVIVPAGATTTAGAGGNGGGYDGTPGGSSGGGGGGGGYGAVTQGSGGGGGLGGGRGYFANGDPPTGGGNGGFGGGGGGAATSNGGGGNGGFGGGGGSSATFYGGAGGFGGGGGGFGDSSYGPGPGGFGGGRGSYGSGSGDTSNGSGGGGLGAGGAIFVMAGANLTIQGGSFAGNAVTSGTGYYSGSAYGADLFSGANVTFDVPTTLVLTSLGGAGNTSDVNITNNAGLNLAGDPNANGGLIKTGAGMLLLTGTSYYSGITTVNSGTLALAPGAMEQGTTVVTVGQNAGDVATLALPSSSVLNLGGFNGTIGTDAPLVIAQAAGSTGSVVIGNGAGSNGAFIGARAFTGGAGTAAVVFTQQYAADPGTNPVYPFYTSLTGSLRVVQDGDGTTQLQPLYGANTFSGPVSVNSGVLATAGTAAALAGATAIMVNPGAVLALGQSNGVGDSTAVSLSDATLRTSTNLTETLGSLSVTGGSSIIDFNGTSSTLNFSTLSLGGNLSIWNYSNANTILNVASGTASGSLSQVTFYSDAGTTYLGAGDFWNTRLFPAGSQTSTVTTAGDLSAAIQTANTWVGPGPFIIDFQTTGTIQPGSQMVIALASANTAGLVINGNGATIDMSAAFGGAGDRAFFIASGSTTISDLTIANGRARGGSGADGAGGGMGAGGAIFVANASAVASGVANDNLTLPTSVTLSNVSFIDNAAIGGAGAGYTVAGQGGGGGMGGSGGAGFYYDPGDFDADQHGGGGGGGLGLTAGGATAIAPGNYYGAQPGVLQFWLPNAAAPGGNGGNSGSAGGLSGGGGGAASPAPWPDFGPGGGGGVGGGAGSGDSPGAGGFGGGGGGGAYQGELYSSVYDDSGPGGFGGGGGGGIYSPGLGQDQAAPGGFGGGGGSSVLDQTNFGPGGFAAGTGQNAIGGGGAGLGGAVFVMPGATLTIMGGSGGGSFFAGNSVVGGTTQVGGNGGSAYGADIFLGGNVVFSPTGSLVIDSLGGAGNLADPNVSSNAADPNAQGGVIVAGSGMLLLTGTSYYTGITTVNSGTLALAPGAIEQGTTVVTVGQNPGDVATLGLGSSSTLTLGGFNGVSGTDAPLVIAQAAGSTGTVVIGSGAGSNGAFVGARFWSGGAGTASVVFTQQYAAEPGTNPVYPFYTTLTGTLGMVQAGLGMTSLQPLYGENMFAGPVAVTSGTLATTGTAAALAGATSIAVNAGGTLLLGQYDGVNDAATVTLAGGMLQTGTSLSETLGALNVTDGGSIIDFLGNASTLNFSTLSLGGSLAIWNYAGANDFLNIASGTSTGSLAQITFYGDSGATFLGWGGFDGIRLVPVAVPEPSTIALVLAGLAGLAARKRPTGRRPCHEGSSGCWALPQA